MHTTQALYHHTSHIFYPVNQFFFNRLLNRVIPHLPPPCPPSVEVTVTLTLFLRPLQSIESEVD